jgi:hypothetical protein
MRSKIITIDFDALTFLVVGSEISSEPSYILLNTAISSQWGFPLKCPAGCDCKKYDCHSTDFAEQCGFSPGFCEMMLEDPIEYKINSVRVYQNPDFEEQKVGCSTPERPTRRYIEGHAKLYKKEFEASEKYLHQELCWSACSNLLCASSF